ncbi:ribosome biogenesis GTP-binding protein YihA/YsxC [Alkalitalea saponilacus]|uniref:Probable GTP-binding protein EngB n=1 Tax=Alkalitalea saponilacus TaxID=889453 RepID=A0A1T5AVF2_9BACT|nr:ribosome biogenesis GTP-binding protein YihA/YsxC [Alkalitalea saponilacus]ASB48586.1 YihA family ribosome biogenesis GTP-binding protein [Alkalitalea saponilacus]SKB38789.1 GTP-binding protein [Alkalitalea saponilacus]
MLIKEARFLVSNQKADKCPPPKMPEYAFIGRSNVGKSSLINMLCNSKKLAKTSSTPGKTQLINHFLINQSWYLVDLPGYGYAKVAKTQRAKFGKMIMDYLATRENLMCLFILVDSRIEPQTSDLEFMRKMGEAQIPFCLIFTKVDKLKKQGSLQLIEKYMQSLNDDWEELPQYFISSAEKGTGREEILQFIEQINSTWNK